MTKNFSLIGVVIEEINPMRFKLNKEVFLLKTVVPLFCCLVMLLTATNTPATIIGTSGDVVKIAPPASVTLRSLESDTQIRAFDETQNFRLFDPLNGF